MQFERTRRTVVLVLIIALVFVGTLRPRPARAVETAVIVIGSIAAYAAVVVVGTILYRRNTPASWGLMPMDPEVRDDQPEPALRLAPGCRQTSAGITLVCW